MAERIPSRSVSSATSVKFTETSAGGKKSSMSTAWENGDTTYAFDSKPSTASVPGDWTDNEQWISDADLIETDEGRLSRSLQQWMPDYKIAEMNIAKPPIEPVFTGRLGKQPRIQRQDSTESITTQLSLFTCSSGGDRRADVTQSRRVRKRKHINNEKENQTSQKQESIWVQLASRRRGAFDLLAKRQRAMHSNAGIVGGVCNFDDTEVFEYMDDDEKRMVFNCAHRKGLCGLKKSGSMTNIREEEKPTCRRVASASSKKRFGRALNFEELKQQAVNRKLEALAKQKQRRTSRHSSRSRMSIGSVKSPDMIIVDNHSVRSVTPETPPEERINIWKGDQQILEIDLKKELTSKVKGKIRTTNEALERITGCGDTNESLTIIGRHDEFPNCVEEDYSVLPKIMQRMRISTDLSSVIQNDIKVRMGRPRYHEICTRDIEMWDKGQILDTFHRNLKVFTWLHSLREKEFTDNVHAVICDKPLEGDDTPKVVMHVEAADEPAVKPLYVRS